MKGIIVVDMPENCFKCGLKKRPIGMHFPEDMICAINGESIYKYKPNNVNGMKPDWCPIREVPVTLEEIKSPHSMGDFQRKGFSRGWNSCIDAITGEK